jgi:hypothetical protein
VTAGTTSRVLSRPVVAGALVVGLALADRIADPADHDVPLCPFRMVTGLNCPLCGGLRAAYALSRFEFAAAVRDNLLAVVALPLLLAYWLDWLRRDRLGRPERRLPRAALAAVWVVAAVFTLLRNLPAGAWLSPPPA